MPQLTPREVQLQLLTTAVTNLSIIPVVIQVLRRRRYVNVVIGMATFLTSLMYHVCDTVGGEIWGMSEGQWHRLDNVFSIVSFQFLMVALMQNRSHETVRARGAPVAVRSRAAGARAPRRRRTSCSAGCT